MNRTTDTRVSLRPENESGRGAEPGARAPRPRAGVMHIAPYVAGRAGKGGARRAIKLSSNESALGASPLAVAAYRRVAADVFRYPDAGAAELRRAIGARHGLDPERIVCGDGSDELLHLLALGYAGSGDEVLFSAHGFVVYPMVAHAVGADPVAAPEAGYTVDVDAMLERAGLRTRVVFVANPNSTGTYLSRTEVARLRAGLAEDVLLVLDAAYAEFVEVPDYSAGEELVAAGENTVMTRTFSKAYGLAGLRLGWCAAPPGVTAVLNRLRGPFNVTLPAQAAGVAALEDTDFLGRVRAHNAEWRPWLAARLAELGLVPVPGVTNFVLVRLPGGEVQADAALSFLNGEGIFVREMKAYGLGDCLRVTVGREDELRALLDALAAFLGA